MKMTLQQQRMTHIIELRKFKGNINLIEKRVIKKNIYNNCNNNSSSITVASFMILFSFFNQNIVIIYFFCFFIQLIEKYAYTQMVYTMFSIAVMLDNYYKLKTFFLMFI